ncbi:MAG: hypothetical protein HFI38_07265 [Lachnospiraceae bacterium]|jgi:hypothetical protein|nr:hypothetical protein [Lachnospiraceae bacterium]
MKTEDREFMLRLVNGSTSIFNKEFSKGAESKEVARELKLLLEQADESLPEPQKKMILDLESRINAAENEACIQAYLEGMIMGAKIVHILLKQEI